MARNTDRLRYVSDSGYAEVVSPTIRASKLITFTGAAGLGAIGAVPLFTLTGKVILDRIIGVVETDLVGATSTLALGVIGSTALLIAATTATDLDLNELWVSATPNATGIAIPAGLQNIAIAADIIGTVAVAAITAGAIRLYAFYTPITSDGALAAT